MEHKSIQEIRDDIEAQMKFLREPLFRSIAAPDPDCYLNACLHVDWDVYAEGYKKAGDKAGVYHPGHGYLPRGQDVLQYEGAGGRV